jgi:hypothetical protein
MVYRNRKSADHFSPLCDSLNFPHVCDNDLVVCDRTRFRRADVDNFEELLIEKQSNITPTFSASYRPYISITSLMRKPPYFADHEINFDFSGGEFASDVSTPVNGRPLAGGVERKRSLPS